MRTNRSGQTVIEISVLTAVVVAALVGMQIYLKRGVSGRWREAADAIGEQYAPRHTTSHFEQHATGITTTSSELHLSANNTGQDVVTTTGTIDADKPEQVTRRGHQEVGRLQTDLWE